METQTNMHQMQDCTSKELAKILQRYWIASQLLCRTFTSSEWNDGSKCLNGHANTRHSSPKNETLSADLTKMPDIIKKVFLPRETCSFMSCSCSLSGQT